MYHTTGFTTDQIRDLCVLVRTECQDLNMEPWPPVLGLYRAVVVALTYMRRNRVQAEIAEAHGVSQSTISRAVTGITPVLDRVLTEFVPTADDLSPTTQYIVDGTLLPCWSWRTHRCLYSGKHKTTGMSVQVACTLDGALAWISDPVTGNHHDSYAINDTEVLVTLNPGDWIGDKGYVGNGMITPYKKPKGGELAEWQKGIQQAGQQDPLGCGTGHREPEDMVNPAHRLPQTACDLHRNDLLRHRVALL
ncbi:transposase family protein [Solwaraspora sp. WMMB335]|uniref:transposase family protein n=1 Tax=Solwaraspora sp. WMMB335 TaxID=3404118 RepID=UPI003B9296DA